MTVKRKTTKDKTPSHDTQISISEFRAWLAGVEDMQSDGWHPNQEQWGRIRAKILSVVNVGGEQVPGKKLVQHIQQIQVQDEVPTLVDQYHEDSLPPRSSSLLGFIPDPPHVGGTAPVRNFATAIGVAKTPDIEASKEGYNSSFV